MKSFTRKIADNLIISDKTFAFINITFAPLNRRNV